MWPTHRSLWRNYPRDWTQSSVIVELNFQEANNSESLSLVLIYKIPQVLLFDEATSALDNESELLVQKALDKVASHKTIIAVAHRLSTIQNYDRIFVLSGGHLVETGTHQELVKKNGEYAKLYELGQRIT